jgi:type III pantothenate kinase
VKYLQQKGKALTKNYFMNSMLNVVVDIGNTRIKVGVFEGATLKEKFYLAEVNELVPVLARPHDHFIISNVKDDPKTILPLSVAKKKIVLSSGSSLPILLKYSSPASLGVDRLAAVCGALQLYPNEDCLIVDMGTCINYELLDSQANYWGGIISPGMKMRFDAMHTFTAKLPLIEAVINPPLVGDSTIACMQSGVINGIVEEVNGIVDRIKSKYPALRVILCGGDTSFFENQLKPPIFAAPELVLMGLNRILIHNVTT